MGWHEIYTYIHTYIHTYTHTHTHTHTYIHTYIHTHTHTHTYIHMGLHAPASSTSPWICHWWQYICYTCVTVNPVGHSRLTQEILMEKGFVCQNPHPAIARSHSIIAKIFIFLPFIISEWFLKQISVVSVPYTSLIYQAPLPPTRINFNRCITVTIAYTNQKIMDKNVLF